MSVKRVFQLPRCCSAGGNSSGKQKDPNGDF